MYPPLLVIDIEATPTTEGVKVNVLVSPGLSEKVVGEKVPARVEAGVMMIVSSRFTLDTLKLPDASPENPDEGLGGVKDNITSCRQK